MTQRILLDDNVSKINAKWVSWGGGGRPECANYRALGAKKVSRLLRDNCLFPEHYEAGVTKTLLTGVVPKTFVFCKTELGTNSWTFLMFSLGEKRIFLKVSKLRWRQQWLQFSKERNLSGRVGWLRNPSSKEIGAISGSCVSENDVRS